MDIKRTIYYNEELDFSLYGILLFLARMIDN